MAAHDVGRYSVGILVISDTVSKGEKIDTSGKNLEKILNEKSFFPLSSLTQECVPDDMSKIKETLESWADDKKIDLILTIGGTGFSARDITPEATKAVIDREAPHLASFMILQCIEKSKFSVLSRSVCGVRKQSLILNLPGSVKGSQECFETIACLIPHILDQIKGNIEKVSKDHVKIQGVEDNRSCH